MLNQTQTAGNAVAITHVTKTFEQWQRSGRIKDLFKSMLHPQKRIVTALDDLSLTVRQGEFLAYAGPNGAGKSTTMKLLAGMLLPSAGDIRVLGLSPKDDRIALMRRLGVLFGNRTELWWDHPVSQSFDWKRVVWNIPHGQYRRMRDMVVELLGLEDILHTFARELSLGQRMRADLGLMLLHEPALILLDEPTLGLDVLAKRRMIDFLKVLNRENGTTIVVTSHDMDDLEEMAQRILLIANGKIAFDGGFPALRKAAGSRRRVQIVTTDGRQPCLPGRLIAQEDASFEFEFDAERLSMREILYEVSKLSNVADIEMKRAPIEEVIAGLYKEWQGEAG